MAMDQRDLEEAVEKAHGILEDMEKRVKALEERAKKATRAKTKTKE